jgi:hypothetical protein
MLMLWGVLSVCIWFIVLMIMLWALLVVAGVKFMFLSNFPFFLMLWHRFGFRVSLLFFDALASVWFQGFLVVF